MIKVVIFWNLYIIEIIGKRNIEDYLIEVLYKGNKIVVVVRDFFLRVEDFRDLIRLTKVVVKVEIVSEHLVCINKILTVIIIVLHKTIVIKINFD